MIKSEMEPTEIEIIEALPRSIRVGNKFILVKQLTYSEYFKLCQKLGGLWLKHGQNIVGILVILQQGPSDFRSKLSREIQLALRIKSLEKDITRLLNWMFPEVGREWFFRKSYLERNMTPEVLLDVVEAIYLYNFSIFKKKILNLKQTIGLDFGHRPAESSSTPSPTSNSQPDGADENAIKPRYLKLLQPLNQSSVSVKTVNLETVSQTLQKG